MSERSAQQQDVTPRQAAVAALDIMGTMVGKDVLGMTSLEPTEDGWLVAVEVLEQARLPRTSDILGLYEVEIDLDGELISYRRVRRYLRATTGDDQRRGAP